ncbi:MAG: sigma-70 family RNA polymerase sigma factor [Planctomycetes bacterium]|nr:sigma-70 family RNA polymerase sigma factor [Planctomycetota bacterium]
MQRCLRWLRVLLPLHPHGYRRYVARMEEIASGRRRFFPWHKRKETLRPDFRAAKSALERAKRLVTRNVRAAANALGRGVRVLRRYPLDSETLYQWAHEAVNDPSPLGGLSALTAAVKVDWLLRRLLVRLEQARERLLVSNFRLVFHELLRFRTRGMERADLFQEGFLGLHRAVFRFDPTRLTKFSTYATYWIRQAIRKALIDRSALIRVPQAIQDALRKPETRLPKEVAYRVQRIMRETVSISAGDDDPEGRRMSETLGDPGLHPVEKLYTEAIPSSVSQALEFLDPREREVIRRRFGIGGEQIQTLDEIGTSFHLSRERIRQLEAEALARLRSSGELREAYEDLALVERTASLDRKPRGGASYDGQQG